MTSQACRATSQPILMYAAVIAACSAHQDFIPGLRIGTAVHSAVPGHCQSASGAVCPAFYCRASHRIENSMEVGIHSLHNQASCCDIEPENGLHAFTC